MKVKFRLHDQSDLVYTTIVPSRNNSIKRIRAITSEQFNGAPESSIRLIYAGKQLEDSQTLFQCNVRDSDIILVMLRKHIQSESPGIEKLESTLDSTEPETKEQNSNVTKEEFFCQVCKNLDIMNCKDCGCVVCGGKDEEENTLVCDECQMYSHMKCLSPPLKDIPKGDWYCSKCQNDPTEIVYPGQKPTISKKKAMMPSATTTKDWGRGGKACVGLSKKCTVVDSDHVGPIPGAPVGSSWRFRINVAEAGVHRPPVAGIAGKAATGAVSIVLAAGYPEDKDEGLEFTYTGAGGRELKEGNRRIGHQTKDQELTGVNEALARTCDCPINLKGGVAKNWRNSRAIRVVRSSKLKKHNAEFALEEGNRYDGIYKIVKYWPEKGESGFKVWRYLMRRDDPEPAPWTREGIERIRTLGLEMYDPDVPPKTQGDRKYEIPENIKDLMAKDSANVRSWNLIRQKELFSLSDFLETVFGDVFSCAICKDKLVSPVTSVCGHNTCHQCLSNAFKNMGKQCPTCRADLSKYPTEVNANLEAIFSKLMTLAPADDTELMGEQPTMDIKLPNNGSGSLNIIPMESSSATSIRTKVAPSKISLKRHAPVNSQSNDCSKKRTRSTKKL